MRLALEMGYSVEEVVCRGDKKIVVAVSASQDKDCRGRRWILDSGAGRHFIAVGSARGLKRVAIDAVRLMTANGVISSKQAVRVKIVGGLTADALVLPDCPNLLSLGRLCMVLGCSFVWRCGKTPILIGPAGQVYRCNVENFVPFVDAEQPVVDRPKWLNSLVAAVVGDGAVPADGVGGAVDGDVGAAEAADPLQKKRPVFKRASLAQAELEEELRSVHNLCHFPANPLCSTCQATKSSAAHHRGGFEKYEALADAFGKVIMLDHKLVPDSFSGIGGEKACLIITDVFSRFTAAFPAMSKDADEVQACLLSVFGRRDGVRLVCDGAREYRAACHRLGWALHPATPHDPTNHAAQERRVGVVSAGIRRLLHRSGLPLIVWPFAAVIWCVHHNALATDEAGQTPWKLKFGEDYSGPLRAFGAACRVVFPIEVRRDGHPFAPTATPCVYLGPVLADGSGDVTRVAVASEEVITAHLTEGKPLTTVIVKLADLTFEGVDRFPFYRTATADGELAALPRAQPVGSWKRLYVSTGELREAGTNFWPVRSGSARNEEVSPLLWKDASPLRRKQACSDVELAWKKLEEKVKEIARRLGCSLEQAAKRARDPLPPLPPSLSSPAAGSSLPAVSPADAPPAVAVAAAGCAAAGAGSVGVCVRRVGGL